MTAESPTPWTDLAFLVASGAVAPDWAQALAPVDANVQAMGVFLAGERAKGRPFLPEADRVFRAFERPLADVRVLIVGQDPYPTPDHPIGLSFAVDPTVRPLPASLRNIYTELASDLGLTPPEHGDLSAWADRGVMLLNRVLTVRPGAPASHAKKGWEQVTDAAVAALGGRGGPLVTVLWGRQAATVRPLLGDTAVIESPHPSPLSARRGFFGSRPFSRVNALLAAQGAAEMDWSLPAG
ncbi:uracil-DNA glycosylase [Nocardioides sp.]|uniref:uracil-DNA glycosylase n=1 Tax=Nocardioides sp. TaxID=35761 RepID=UPI0026099B8A|nr:uracil-DNA glycosylase [Nocardioides sp.]